MGLRNHFLSFFLVLLLCLNFLLIGMKQVNKAIDPGFEDTASLLQGAIYVKENGGILNFIKLSVTGAYEWPEQHPLYWLILSPFAERNLNFVQKAKLISLAIGVICVITLFLVAGDLYGKFVGLMSSFLLIYNESFLYRSSRVDCEPLLILLVLLSWYFMIKGAKEKKYWIPSGIFSGLAYMTKESGLFLIPVFIISGLIIFKLGILKNRYFWLFFLGLFVTSFPLILRNNMSYKNPFYEGINGHMIWLDNWEQIHNPYVRDDPPTMITYFKSHSLSEIVSRVVNGSLGEGKLFLKTTSITPVPKVSRGLDQPFRISLFLFFIFGLVKRNSIPEKIYTVVTILIFFIFFSWYYQVVPNMRFITPLIPLVLVISSLGIIEILNYVDIEIFNKYLNFNLLSRLAYVLGVFLILTLGYSVTTQPISYPLSSVKVADGYYELMSWMGNNIQEDDVYILHPAHTFDFQWYVDFKGQQISFPHLSNFSEFTSFIKRNGITLIILTKENYFRRRDLLKDYFEYNEADGLIEKKSVDGWRLIYKHSGIPTQFRIYKVD